MAWSRSSLITAPNIELVQRGDENNLPIFWHVVCHECGDVGNDYNDFKAQCILTNHLVEHHTEMMLELSELLQQLKESIIFGQTDNWKPNGQV